jgi:transposase
MKPKSVALSRCGHERAGCAAIEAALMLSWSHGQIEGQVPWLKVVKRAVYGRGGLDLLDGRLRRSA